LKVSNPNVSKNGKKRRLLPPSEKYELWVSVLSGQATQREAAEKYRVDRSTVTQVCKTAKQGALDALAAAKPGRRGQSAEEVELAEAREEIERLRSTITEQAVALHLYEGKSRWD
jgi:transposase-like protein